MIQPVNVRIDERLIHGQVAALWSSSLQINRIVVVDSDVIKSDMQKMLLKSATPSGIKLSIISVQRAAENFKIDKYAQEKAMVIVKNPQVLKELKDQGVIFDQVNVGNMPKKTDTRTITGQIYLSEEQEALFRQLSQDTKFYVQLVPTDPQKDFLALMEK